MRFATALASISLLLTAVSSTPVPAFPVPFFQGLPQISTTASTIQQDLTAMDASLLNLTAALKEAASKTPNNDDMAASHIQAVGSVLSCTIGFQSATRQAMLDAQELGGDVFSADDSEALVVAKLRDDVLPHATTALQMLQAFKTQPPSSSSPVDHTAVGWTWMAWAILSYLDIVGDNFAQFVAALLPYVDPGSRDAAEAVLGEIGGVISATIDVYNG